MFQGDFSIMCILTTMTAEVITQRQLVIANGAMWIHFGNDRLAQSTTTTLLLGVHFVSHAAQLL
jgi:hypothetical protein